MSLRFTISNDIKSEESMRGCMFSFPLPGPLKWTSFDLQLKDNNIPKAIPNNFKQFRENSLAEHIPKFIRPEHRTESYLNPVEKKSRQKPNRQLQTNAPYATSTFHFKYKTGLKVVKNSKTLDQNNNSGDFRDESTKKKHYLNNILKCKSDHFNEDRTVPGQYGMDARCNGQSSSRYTEAAFSLLDLSR